MPDFTYDLRREVHEGATSLTLPAPSFSLARCVPGGGPDCARTTVTYEPVGDWHPGLSADGPAQERFVRIVVTSTRTADGLVLATVHANLAIHWSLSELVVEPASEASIAAARVSG